MSARSHYFRDVTILLVEDDDSVLRSTTRILGMAGYKVLSASSGREAVRIADVDPIDVVVTDVIMPGGMSGKELADHLRRQRPDLPVIFVSGHSVETITERGILSSNTHLVNKPFAPGELLHAIREAVPHYEAAHA